MGTKECISTISTHTIMVGEKSFPMDDGGNMYIYIYFIFNVMGTDDLITQGAMASAIMVLIYSHQTAAAC